MSLWWFWIQEQDRYEPILLLDPTSSFTQSSQKKSALKINLISVEPSLTEDGSKEGDKSEKLINESNQVIQKNDDNHIANIEEVHEDVVNEVESSLPLKNVLSKELPVENEKK